MTCLSNYKTKVVLVLVIMIIPFIPCNIVSVLNIVIPVLISILIHMEY